MTVWKQERPQWCPHRTCRYRASSQAALCVGELPEPEPHDGTPNTHRLCIHGNHAIEHRPSGNTEAGEWTFDLQINRGDAYTIWRLLKGLFGLGQGNLEASVKEPTP